MAHNPLGLQTEYISVYAPQLLFPIKRAGSRQQLGINAGLPFYGVDIWTGYELSWLDLQGKPIVAVAEFWVPCTSECIVESKSFKLYLNSFNQTRFTNEAEVQAIIARDLSRVAEAEVMVTLIRLNQVSRGQSLAHVESFAGESMDELPIAIDVYHPAPELLSVVKNEWVEESLRSDLLKTNCPVTGQPDWASIEIRYKGERIQKENLLRYIVSFREHQDFHEQCVERIFTDILQQCRPQSLTVYARYTRRGGLDINPFRTTEADLLPATIRLIRQ